MNGTMTCNACPDRLAHPSAHCQGCGQHLNRSPRYAGVWTGVRCRAECDAHPSGYHRPATCSRCDSTILAVGAWDNDGRLLAGYCVPHYAEACAEVGA